MRRPYSPTRPAAMAPHRNPRDSNDICTPMAALIFSPEDPAVMSLNIACDVKKTRLPPTDATTFEMQMDATDDGRIATTALAIMTGRMADTNTGLRPTASINDPMVGEKAISKRAAVAERIESVLAATSVPSRSIKAGAGEKATNPDPATIKNMVACKGAREGELDSVLWSTGLSGYGILFVASSMFLSCLVVRFVAWSVAVAIGDLENLTASAVDAV